MLMNNYKFERIISKKKIINLLSIHKSYYEKIIRKKLLQKKLINSQNIFLKNKLKLINLSDIDKKIITGHYPLKFRLKIFKKLITERKLMNKLKKILNTKKIYIYIPTMSRYALPNCKLSLTPWHDDSSYNPHFKKFVTVWIPLIPINKRIGGICFLNDSQVKAKNETKKKEVFFSKYKLSKKPSVRHYECNIGDALIFNNRTIHKSVLNKSKIIRYSIDFRVSSSKADNKHCYSVKEKKNNSTDK